ncbi:MAG TPA: hypothetical protein VGA37_05455 [Gemmatimonadales bacterium]
MKPLAIALCLCCLLGCSGDPEQGPSTGSAGITTAGPAIVLIESVVLQESDTLYLGRPLSMAIDETDGSLYIGDTYGGRVIRYDRRGQPIGVYGAPGTGPGEIGQLGAVFLVPGAIGVVDTRTGSLKLFDREQGIAIRSAPFFGIPNPVIAPASGRVWIGARIVSTNSSIVAWDPKTDSLEHMGPMPVEFTTYPNLPRFNTIPVVPWADTLLVGWGPLNGLVLMTTRDQLLDTIIVPVVRRRGASTAAIQAAGTDLAPLLNGVSLFIGMHRRPDGSVALVHFDNHVETERVPRITASVFVSVLSADRSRVCADGQVPVVSDAQPVVQLAGDTLFVLEQRVVDTTTTSQVRMFRIDTAACDWVSIKPPTNGLF